MFTKNTLLAVAAAAAGAQAAVPQGFNYGSTGANNAPRTTSDFTNLFQQAQGLSGTTGFNSARLYTMIQAGTTNSPISALQAAIDTKTTLLLGLWASEDSNAFKNELAALSSAISMNGLAQYVVGISVGSEDLYRISPTGLSSPNAGAGQEPSTLVDYINSVKSLTKGTAFDKVPIGHVDTWTAWVNSSNSDVINAVDFLGVDAYPYFQNTMANSIDNGQALFQQAFGNTQGASGGKPVWITETGWPVSGPTENQATTSTQNAKSYWDSVGCPNFGKVPTFWYTLEDGVSDPTVPSFSVAHDGTPLFDLSCSGVSNQSSSTTAFAATATTAGLSASIAGASSLPTGAFSTGGSGAIVTGTGSSGSGSGASNGTYTAGSPAAPSKTAGSSAGGSGAAASASGTGIATAGAASFGVSIGSIAALAAAVAALL